MHSLIYVCISNPGLETKSTGGPGAPITPAHGLLNGALSFGLCPCDQLVSLGLSGDSEHGEEGSSVKETSKLSLVAVSTLHSADISAVCVLSNSSILRPRDLRGKTYASCG